MSLAADQTEQGRLSRAVRPDERSAFARRDGKAYPVHGAKTFKGLRDSGEAQSEIARVSHKLQRFSGQSQTFRNLLYLEGEDRGEGDEAHFTPHPDPLPQGE